MIRFAKTEDMDALLSLAKQSYALKETPFLEYYFAHDASQSRILVNELDGKIVSEIHESRHVVCLNRKKIEASYLFGLATHFDYRQRGIMKELLDLTLEDASKNVLITYMEAFNPKMFEKFGFFVVANRKKYVVYAKEVVRYRGNPAVDERYDAKSLKACYEAFMRVFDGWFVRNEDDFETLIDYTIHTGGNICVYHEGELLGGYCIYEEMEDGVEVREVAYKDQRTLCSLLAYAIGFLPYIRIDVSESEHLEKIFKLSIPRTLPFTLARINNLKLFNKLYNSDARNAKDLSQVARKPIYLNDKR